MTFEFIKYSVQDNYATIVLNRPEKRNALSMGLMTELSTALWEADDDTEVHAARIMGAGKDFCAGYDLTPLVGASNVRPRLRDSMYRRGGLYEDTWATTDDDAWRLEYSQRLRMSIFDMHKPVIAQIHGNCLAGGTDIALLCDMIFIAEDASIGVPPTRDIGTTPNNMWLYHLGPQWAKRLLLTGDTLSGIDAARAGLALKAVPAKLLDAEVVGLLKRLGRIDNELLAGNKRIVNIGLELMGARTLQRLSAENDARLHTAEASRRFRETSMKKGLRTALAERNARYPDCQARFDRLELRDEEGRFLPDAEEETLG